MNTSATESTLFGINLSQYPWLWEVFTLVLLTLMARYVVGLILRKLEQQLKKTHTLWDDALLEAAHKPAGWLVWFVGFSWVLEVLVVESEAFVFTTLGPVRELAVVMLLAWFLIRVIKQVETRLMSDEYSEDPMDPTTVLALGKLVRAAVVITVALVMLQTLGYSISGVLAFGGVGGIAVGFAAKDLLANFFGGLMVYLDRPFAVGDWIRSPDQEIEGTVEHIGWRQTRIRTFSRRPLYIPNATFSHISVENPSRMLNRRIYETIGIRYDDADKLKAIVSDVTDLLKNHEEIDQQQTIIVNFNSFAPSSLDFFIYTFTKTTDWIRYHEIKQDILLNIINIVESNGAECAFPTSTLHISTEIDASNAKVPK